MKHQSMEGDALRYTNTSCIYTYIQTFKSAMGIAPGFGYVVEQP